MSSVGKEHGDLLALAFESGAGREDLVGEMCRHVGARGTLRRRGWRRGRLGRRGVAGPHQHGAILVHGHPLDLDEFGP
jgi:hypothetical protein